MGPYTTEDDGPSVVTNGVNIREDIPIILKRLLLNYHTTMIALHSKIL